jgi:hypothetical protein
MNQPQAEPLRLQEALMDIIRACEGGTPIGDRNWNSGIKQIATVALDEVGFDWKRELNFPPAR